MKKRDIIIPEMEKASDEQVLANWNNISKEKEQYLVQIEHNKTILKDNIERIALLKVIHKISEDKNHMLKPSFSFQEDLEWIDTQRKFLRINNRSERRAMEREIKSLKESIENTNTELARFDKAMPMVEEELKKRGVKYE